MPVLPNGVDTSQRRTYGSGNALSSEAVAQLLYQAGFRGEDLIYFTGVAMRESANQPGIRGTEADPSALTGDFGLFGINSVNDTPAAKAAVGYVSRAQWTDPLVNAKMAFYMSKGGSNRAPWAGSSQGYQAGGDPNYGVNMTAARTAVNNASNQGLLGQNWTGGSTVSNMTTGTGASGAPDAASPTGTFDLPPDAHRIRVGPGGPAYAMFDVGGVHIAYAITANSGVNPPDLVTVTQAQWDGYQAVDGGDALELASIGSTFGSYHAFYDSILAQVMGFNNPAKDDPEVRRVLAEYAGRPNMELVELNNRLQATTWWKTRTTGELEWNGLADAEKQKRRDDTAAQMVAAWTQFTGQQIAGSDPRIANHLEEVASGKMGIGAWTENIVKAAARDIANSPLNRDIADEQKAEKQPGIDVENTALRIRQQNAKWGLRWSESTIQDWARRIVNKDSSDDDLLEEQKNQAQVLYPWKSRDMDTQTAAGPWTETYKRVMERDGDLTTPDIQKALTAGTPAWEFEQGLKKTSGWLETKNAREQLTSMAGSVGKMLGFS